MNKNARIFFYSFIVLLLIFVLLLVTILISYIVYNTFADWETIIAGCIGFVGAILGGLLTLLGVRITIKETRRDKEKEILPQKLATINVEKNYVIQTLSEIDNLYSDDSAQLYEYASFKRKEIKEKYLDPNIYYLGEKLFTDYIQVLDIINRVTYCCILIHVGANDKEKLIKELRDLRIKLNDNGFKFWKECEDYFNKLVKEFYS